jgi:hypothetical protein
MTSQTEITIKDRVESDVLAVIENRGDAIAAARELIKLGLHAADFKFLHGGDLVDLIEPESEHCSLLQHAAHALWGHLTEELTDKRVGPYVIAVHTHRSEQVEQVLTIFKANLARNIEVVGHSPGWRERR